MKRLVLGVMWVVLGAALLTCEMIPEAPQLFQPVDGAEVTHPTFIWGATGDEYELHLSQDSTFATVKETWNKVGYPAFTPSDTLDAGTYYWRVRAYKNNWSEWSEVRSFTIDITHDPT